MRTIAIDLPAHGESGGPPAPLEQVRRSVHELLVALARRTPDRRRALDVRRAGLPLRRPPIRRAASSSVDNGPDIRPFAELVRRLEPALRGPGFAEVWPTFENSLGLERIPEPARSLVLARHEVNQDVVLGYWETCCAPIRPSSRRGSTGNRPKLDVPCLGVFGRPITDGERERFAAAGRAARGMGGGWPLRPSGRSRPLRRGLRQFVDHCRTTDTGPCSVLAPAFERWTFEAFGIGQHRWRRLRDRPERAVFPRRHDPTTTMGSPNPLLIRRIARTISYTATGPTSTAWRTAST